MIFNSYTYIFFLGIFTFIYWCINQKYKKNIIFFSSIIFYGFWRIDFLLLLFFTIYVNFFFSKKIYNEKKKIFLIFVISINLCLLFIFKYFYFFLENINLLLNLYNKNNIIFEIKILLPIGISFYTFQAISYALDLRKGKIQPINNFYIFANYIIFFPQLVAGPIVRASEIVWQFEKKTLYENHYIIDGIKIILLGLFLKVVIADNIAPFVEIAFDTNPKTLSAIDVITCAFLFGFQIYFDFSAYSQIAIGSALLIGIKLPQNFNFPYHSSSPKEFWSKWHITLTLWIRDYVYFNLLSKKKRTQLITSALFITWITMGAWHGASYNFIIWGIYNFTLIILFRYLNRYISLFKNYRFISFLFFMPLIMIGWIPFRSPDISHTLEMWGQLFYYHDLFSLNFHENIYLITFLITIIYFILPYLKNIFNKFYKNNLLIDFLKILILSFFIFIYLEKVEQFIYFQF